ncbi:hypothetical protein BGX33_012438, partial [Mortierella sp. NVP41]
MIKTIKNKLSKKCDASEAKDLSTMDLAARDLATRCRNLKERLKRDEGEGVYCA